MISAAKEYDAPAIAEVHLASWLATYRGILSDAYLDSLKAETFEGYHRPRLQDRSEKATRSPFLIACDVRDPKSILGFTRAGPTRASAPTGDPLPAGFSERFSAELYAIYVHPKHFGQGIGNALFNATVRELRQLGHETLCVWVLTANAVARKFYERQGGELVDEAQITLGGLVYPEVAYGWDRLSSS